MQPAPYRQRADDSRASPLTFWVGADDGVRLRLASWHGADRQAGTVLLFPGRTEYIEKYADVAQELGGAGYGVLCIDWRGQGLSDRLLDDPLPGHVAHFSDYQRDVVEMLVAAAELELPRPWHLLAHSMGGCIGLAALCADLSVSSAVFSAPMWGIRLGLLPEWFVRGLTGFAKRTGRGGLSAPQRGKGSGYVLEESFRDNLLTGDVDRWTQMVREAAYWPELTIAGASYNWVLGALDECRRLADATLPDLPTLIAHGSDERIVSIPAIQRQAARWPQAQLREYEGGRHELLMEVPAIRSQFLADMIAHFRAYS